MGVAIENANALVKVVNE